MRTQKIFCIQCDRDVDARLTTGEEAYPHRKDLYAQHFWKCDACKNFVGTHHRSDTPTKPLGVIPTREVKDARMRIHATLDPLWRNGLISRGKAYRHIADRIGKEYHTGEIRSVEEANRVWEIVDELRRGISQTDQASMLD